MVHSTDITQLQSRDSIVINILVADAIKSECIIMSRLEIIPQPSPHGCNFKCYAFLVRNRCFVKSWHFQFCLLRLIGLQSSKLFQTGLRCWADFYLVDDLWCFSKGYHIVFQQLLVFLKLQQLHVSRWLSSKRFFTTRLFFWIYQQTENVILWNNVYIPSTDND